MSEQPCSKLVTGIVEIHETGETFEHATMITNSIMESIVKVQCVYRNNTPNLPMQLLIECLALDSGGEVFELDIHFPFLDLEEYSQFMKIFTVGALWKVKGMFYTGSDDGQISITLLGPEFHRLAPENVSDVESAFRINGKRRNAVVDDD